MTSKCTPKPLREKAIPFLCQFGQPIVRPRLASEYSYDPLRQVRLVRADVTWIDVLDSDLKDEPPQTMYTLVEQETSENQ